MEVVQESSRCTEQRIAAIDALADEVSEVKLYARRTENRRSRDHGQIDALDLKLWHLQREMAANKEASQRRSQRLGRLAWEDHLTRDSVERVAQSLKKLKATLIVVGVPLLLAISILACCVYGWMSS